MGRPMLVAVVVAAFWTVVSLAADGPLEGTWTWTEPVVPNSSMTFHEDGTLEFYWPPIGSSKKSDQIRFYWSVEYQDDPIIVVIAYVAADDTQKVEGTKLRIRFLTPDMIEVVGIEDLVSGHEEELPGNIAIMLRQK